jgi:uncharacterized protein
MEGEVVMGSSITAAMLFDMVTCPHRVCMDLHADQAQRDPPSPFLQLLWERGTAHEARVVEDLGLARTDLGHLSGDALEAATAEAMAAGAPLIYGGRIRDGDLLGMPDLLRLDDDGYVAGDIKSGAGEEAGKPRRSYAMQLALYTDILERQDVSAGRYGFIIDGHGEETSYELDAPRGPRTPLTLWQEYQKTLDQARRIVASDDASRPALTAACKLCAWRSACIARLERDDDLSLLPEVGRATRDAIASHYPTVAALAAADPDDLPDMARQLEGVGATLLKRLYERACLNTAGSATAYRRAAIELPECPREIFFDVEVDPLRDHCYLHGFLERAPGAKPRYRGFFAADAGEDSEEKVFAEAWAYLSGAGDAAVFHYGVYERTIWRALQSRYPHVCDIDELEALFADPDTVDLYTAVIRPRTEWPTRDYSVKSIAGFLGFGWRDDDPSGASSIQWYEEWLETGDAALKKRLLAYNEDDCRATAVVLDGVRALEPPPWED